MTMTPMVILNRPSSIGRTISADAELGHNSIVKERLPDQQEDVEICGRATNYSWLPLHIC